MGSPMTFLIKRFEFSYEKSGSSFDDRAKPFYGNRTIRVFDLRKYIEQVQKIPLRRGRVAVQITSGPRTARNVSLYFGAYFERAISEAESAGAAARY